MARNQPTIIPRYNMMYFDEDIAHIYYVLRKIPSSNLATKIKIVSDFFIGKSYFRDSLGEGPNAIFDKNPLYRTDKFDCETFVDTVLAIVESKNLLEFKRNILKIRYENGAASFMKRNHFTSCDWNLNNEANGYLQDINSNVINANGEPIAVIATAFIDKPNWYRKMPIARIKTFAKLSNLQAMQLLKKLHNYGNKVKVTKNSMFYLPLNKLFKNNKANQQLFAQIPSGTVIEIVRPNWELIKKIGTNLNVSHLGLGVRINGKLMFREASSINKKIEDVDLEQYLKQYLNHKTIKGISVKKIIIPFQAYHQASF